MNGTSLASRIASGYARAGALAGTPYTQYRPASATAPMATPIGTLNTLVKPMGRPVGAPSPPANAFFDALLDTTQLQPGDILAGAAGTFFVWQLPPLGPALCVGCNATIAVRRPQQPGIPGFNDLGQLASATETVLMDGWPASVLREGRGERSASNLPGTGRVGSWMVLLPVFAGVTVAVADIIVRKADAVRMLVELAEQGRGWRLLAQEVSA
jgi:hypothetical protein